jgi:hypothetical protein
MALASSGVSAPAQRSLGHPPRFCGTAVLQAAGARPLCYGSGLGTTGYAAAHVW